MAEPTPVAGVILAGGQSRRMGQDKALLAIAGRPLLAHVIERLAPQASPLALNANTDAARFTGFGLPVIADCEFAGPLAGILTAMHWARKIGAPLVVTVPVDTPFIPADLVAGLVKARGDAGIAIARSRSRLHPTVGLWPASLADLLDGWLTGATDLSVRAFLASQSVAMADFAEDEAGDPFFNINTPEDAATAAARLADN
jgi:molybdopterin-guanine dinucleotide biosynthesis protein A